MANAEAAPPRRRVTTARDHARVVHAWCMYDWANSAFATTVVAAVLPPFFAALAKAVHAGKCRDRGVGLRQLGGDGGERGERDRARRRVGPARAPRPLIAGLVVLGAASTMAHGGGAVAGVGIALLALFAPRHSSCSRPPTCSTIRCFRWSPSPASWTVSPRAGSPTATSAAACCSPSTWCGSRCRSASASPASSRRRAFPLPASACGGSGLTIPLLRNVPELRHRSPARGGRRRDLERVPQHRRHARLAAPAP